MRIRALEPEDLELLYTIENNRQLWWLGTQTAPLSRYRLRDYIATNEGDIFKDEQVRFAIDDDDNNAVGVIDLFNFSPLNNRAELGIALLKEAQHKGLAQKAIAEIMNYAREVISLHQIYAIVPTSNEASIRMLSAVGFSESGVLKEWVEHGSKYEDATIMQLFL